MSEKEIRAARAKMMFALVYARIEEQGRQITDMTPEEIEREVDEAARMLKLALAEEYQK